MNGVELIFKNGLGAGGVTGLAKALGVTPPTVSQWKKGVRQVPADRCPDIERTTSGRIRCEDLRPDVDWEYLRGTAKSEQSA